MPILWGNLLQNFTRFITLSQYHDSSILMVAVVLGLVDIFKSGREWSHMRDFMYIKCCAKGFFSDISILDNKWLLKIAKKNEKMRFSLQWAGIRKSYTI